jgi:hypothetical protein
MLSPKAMAKEIYFNHDGSTTKKLLVCNSRHHTTFPFSNWVLPSMMIDSCCAGRGGDGVRVIRSDFRTERKECGVAKQVWTSQDC